MSALRESSATATTTLPIEVHVFTHGDVYYAFDVRNYAILKLDRYGAAVLSRMAASPLDEIVRDLAGEIPASTVRGHYLKFLEMIRDGILSVDALPRPSRPPFNHLVLMLAGGCNMGCAYCFEKDVPIYQKPNLMTV